MENPYEIIAVLNPLYWLGEWLINIQTLGSREHLHILNLSLSMIIWAIIALFLAEIAAQESGDFFLKYIVFLFFNIWAVGIYWYLTDLKMKKNAMVATGNGMIRKKVKVSEIVTSAVNIYSPSELGEHHIQDLADEKKFDEAIHLILKKVELLRAEEKNDLAEKYQTVVQWLEAAKQRARESREESE